ncbi:MAG: Sigma-70 region 4 type 2 [Paenibacillus sp.]|jgi:endogenous inhibitor of DNA gyrase (YacG/DUF329 family)|nr:Sigma-70 region 4 type 2 [Paenibacillus sp.]
MTEEQKSQIKNLRVDGYGYNRIAQVLGISENTVKSFCRRNNLTGKAAVEIPKAQAPADEGKRFCMYCGVTVAQNPGRKVKKFCSDKCRMKWWNDNLDKVKRKAMYEYICPHCGKRFKVYGNSRRKYCSHECYVADRFGGGQDE